MRYLIAILIILLSPSMARCALPIIPIHRVSVVQHVCADGTSCTGKKLITSATPTAVRMQRTVQREPCPKCGGVVYVEIWTVMK